MTGSDRRGFLSWLLGGSMGSLFLFLLYPVLRFVKPPAVSEATTAQVDAGPANDPELLDRGYKIIRFGDDPVILVRVSADDIRAFSATCTHLGCIVGFRKDKDLIWCNCHNGEFDLSGQVVGGPPPRPLQSFQVNLVARGPGQPATVVVSRA